MSKGDFKEKYNFYKVSEVSNIFQGDPTVSNGWSPNANFYRSPYNL